MRRASSTASGEGVSAALIGPTWAGWIAALAAKPSAAAARQLGGERLGVAQREAGRVDGGHAAQRRRPDHRGAPVQQRLPGDGGPEVGREVGRPQHQGGEPRRRPRDRVGRGEPAGGFDERHQPRRAGGARQQGVDEAELVRRFRLGDEEVVRLARRREQGREVGEALRRTQRVDPQRGRDARTLLAGQEGERVGAGPGLRRRGDGVLEVDDQDVGAGLRGPGEAVRPGAGGEEPAPPRACRHPAHGRGSRARTRSTISPHRPR